MILSDTKQRRLPMYIPNAPIDLHITENIGNGNKNEIKFQIQLYQIHF